MGVGVGGGDMCPFCQPLDPDLSIGALKFDVITQQYPDSRAVFSRIEQHGKFMNLD